MIRVLELFAGIGACSKALTNFKEENRRCLKKKI